MPAMTTAPASPSVASTSDEEDWLQAPRLGLGLENNKGEWLDIPWKDLKDPTSLPKNVQTPFERTRNPDNDIYTRQLPDGSDEHICYIPTWTHPTFKRFEEKVPAGHRRARGLMYTVRPAMLPSDNNPVPTKWATRYGYHDEGRHEGGRSCLSPPRELTMRVNLPKTMMTPSNQSRDYVDYQDATTFKYGPNNDIIIDVAMNEYFDKMQAEEDYQTTWWYQLTSNDLVDNKFVSFEANAGNELTNNLHPVLTRDRWRQRVDQGKTEDAPMWVYDFNPHNAPVQNFSTYTDEVWVALQPALQMVSKVLWAKHPSFEALKSFFKMRRIPENLDPLPEEEKKIRKKAKNYTFRHSVWRDIDQAKMFPAATSLYSKGFFDCEGAIDDILDQRLIFTIQRLKGAWAQTNWAGPEMGAAANYDKICITLNVDAVWPLLAPKYTPDEKLRVSHNIATGILHELAHAVNYAMVELTLWARKRWIPSKKTIVGPISTFTHLTSIGKALYGGYTDFLEMWFEDDGTAEPGFAIENRIFGGSNTGIFWGLSGNFAWDTTITCMDPWPMPNFRPSVHPIDEQTPTLLLYPLPVTLRRTPIPAEETRRYFTNDFWNVAFAQYGDIALRMRRDKMPKQIVYTGYRRKKDLVKMLGFGLATWMDYVMAKLNDCRFGLTTEYLHALVERPLASTRLRKRWHEEKKIWQKTDEHLEEMVVQCADALTQVNATVGKNSNQRSASGAPQNMSHSDEIELQGHVDDLIGRAEDFHAFIVRLIQNLQSYAADYLQQSGPNKKLLWTRYLKDHVQRIEDTLIQAVERVRDNYQDAQISTHTFLGDTHPAAAKFMTKFTILGEKSKEHEEMLRFVANIFKSPASYEGEDATWIQLASVVTQSMAARIRSLQQASALELKHAPPRDRDSIRAVVGKFKYYAMLKIAHVKLDPSATATPAPTAGRKRAGSTIQVKPTKRIRTEPVMGPGVPALERPLGGSLFPRFTLPEQPVQRMPPPGPIYFGGQGVQQGQVNYNAGLEAQGSGGRSGGDFDTEMVDVTDPVGADDFWDGGDAMDLD